jgi:serine phosphatase RsbU (regulator of sigma subunit)
MESKRQQTIILYTFSALAVVSLLLAFSIWQYRQKNRSKKALEVANGLIQEKNREITDSIRYAHQIQTAILPSEEEFSSYFTDAFVLFRPKDIISGDFYWVTKIDGKVIYATADCTGHGVPGGFMSMLGMSMLNELVNENRLTDPAEILGRLRDKVIAALKQKGVSGEQQDGMDMTLMVLDPSAGTLKYAMANHVFYLLRNGELQEFKGDKFPVGIYGDKLKPFTTHEVSVLKGDRIITFSDGYADQFGGPKGKKLKYKKMQEFLLERSEPVLSGCKIQLVEGFDSWKGEHEQVDDVCVIGVTV